MIRSVSKASVKKLIQSALRRCGYTITRIPEVQRGFHPSYLSRICDPKTVIDVGVANGTPGLYEAYPRAKFVLVEPLIDYKSAIDEIARKYDCVVCYKAAGCTEGTAEINVNPDSLRMSSFKERLGHGGSTDGRQKRQVQMTTLDTIVREHGGFPSPILLKIDAVGYEMEVLQGARRLLQETDTLIVGVSVGRRFIDGYSFEDLILFMRGRGFYLYDFLAIAYRTEGLRPNYADIAFKRDAMPVRPTDL
jgi:FkbM family methyltransferase